MEHNFDKMRDLYCDEHFFEYMESSEVIKRKFYKELIRLIVLCVPLLLVFYFLTIQNVNMRDSMIIADFLLLASILMLVTVMSKNMILFRRGIKYRIYDDGIQALVLSNSSKICLDWKSIKRVFWSPKNVSFIKKSGGRLNVPFGVIDRQKCVDVVEHYCKIYNIPTTERMFCIKSAPK